MVSYSTNEPMGKQAPGPVEVPLFQQIARGIEDDIVNGLLPEGDQAPSTNEIAAFHQVNPATALKGVNQLVADGVLYKRRGIGMFVTDGARTQLLDRRRAGLADRHLRPLLEEARLLGLSPDDVARLLVAEATTEEDPHA